MTERLLSVDEIRELSRDLRILLATNGTLTRILNVVADEEIVVHIVDQRVHHIAPKVPDLQELPLGRVLQRNIVLKGRSTGKPFVAAESLIAIDLLPPELMTSLTTTDCPIGEAMAASCLETFKEAPTVWVGELPTWLEDGYRDSHAGTVGRRYRIIAAGQPVIVITEYFLQNCIDEDAATVLDRRPHSNGKSGRSSG